MAIRNVRITGDPILRKKSKEIVRMTDRISELIEDMFDTMYDQGGVGLAAPQVGVLKDIFVCDCSEEAEPLVFINPVITETSGEQSGYEGCLSVPGYQGTVKRAERVVVRYLDRDMKERETEASGLLARCIQHEYDHLQGILYTDLVEGELVSTENTEEEAQDA